MHRPFLPSSFSVAVGHSPMTGQAMGFSDRKDQLPSRGERVAAWVEAHMARTGLSISELAFKAQVDKRDLRRLLHERSCGWRLEDDLAALFGWDFIEAVMTPVVGVDPLTAKEREVEARLAEAAALNARVARERVARMAGSPTGPSFRVVARSVDFSSSPMGGGA